MFGLAWAAELLLSAGVPLRPASLAPPAPQVGSSLRWLPLLETHAVGAAFLFLDCHVTREA